MNKVILNLTIYCFLSLLLLELSSFILIKLNYLPNGITPRVTMIPHKDFGFWHHKNRSFRLASECWNSKVTYNNHGMRQTNNVEYKKNNKKRIAIIGDSMSENLEVSDGKDFGSLVQKKLDNFEILNFSVRSTGLGDHIELYNKLIKKFEVDYIFLFVSDNDFEDNYYLSSRPSQNKYKIENNKVIKLPIDEVFFENQTKIINKLKKENLVFIKEYFRTFILYSHFKGYLMYNIHKRKNQVKSQRVRDPFFEYTEKSIVYKFLVAKFLENLTNNEKLIVFTNPRPKIISQEDFPEKKNIKMMAQIWGDKYIIDATDKAINFLKDDNNYKHPYLSFDCDGHFSEYGASFMSDFVVESFLKL